MISMRSPSVGAALLAISLSGCASAPPPVAEVRETVREVRIAVCPEPLTAGELMSLADAIEGIAAAPGVEPADIDAVAGVIERLDEAAVKCREHM